MDKQIKEIQEVEQLLESIKKADIQISEPGYLTDEDVFLSDDEKLVWVRWALNKARKKKKARLEEIMYAEKIRKDKGYPQFDFESLKAFVLKSNPHFIIDDSNEDIFDMVCMYFSNDPAFELEGYSFNKGIMLVGPVGCGKTELMRVFSINSFRPFCVTACRQVADEYAINGTQSLYQYSELKTAYPQLNFGHEKIGQCFDDLGTEDDKKNFGNSVNVMADVVLKLYDNRNFNNFHITTNIGGDEISEIYGDRVRSRMREMFNVFKFDPSSKDRRK